MKTAKEWFQELPEPARSEAIENTKTVRINMYFKSLNEALQTSFNWEDSKQGFIYWHNIHKKL